MEKDLEDVIYNFDMMSIEKKVLDLDYFEEMMYRFSRHNKNYLDFVLFVRRMVPYIEKSNTKIIIGEDVKRLL